MAMLRRLRKDLRVKAAVALMTLYTLCLVTPAAALAFNGEAATHCLTGQHGMASAHDHGIKSHVHADGTVHRHADEDRSAANQKDTDRQAHPGNCCGLFCMSALALDVENFPVTQVVFAPDFPSLESKLAGRGPERINRPPIA